jgi:hypothetical protein
MRATKVYRYDPAIGKRRWWDLATETPPPAARIADSRNLRSVAAGINPDQIAEMKQKFPHHNFDPQTGDMLFKDRNEKLRHLSEIGMHDRDEVRGGS